MCRCTQVPHNRLHVYKETHTPEIQPFISCNAKLCNPESVENRMGKNLLYAFCNILAVLLYSSNHLLKHHVLDPTHLFDVYQDILLRFFCNLAEPRA